MASTGPTHMYAALWTGRTGRAIRAHHETRDVMTYLVAGPEQNAYGIFQIDPRVIAVNLARKEKEVHEAIDRLIAVDFCRWDEATGWIWVLNMAALQFRPLPLKNADYRSGAAKKWYRAQLPNPFLGAWWDRYAADFHLGSDPNPVERREWTVAQEAAAEAPATTESPPQIDSPYAPVPRTVRTEVQEIDLFGSTGTKKETIVRVPGKTTTASRAEIEAAFERMWRTHPNGKERENALEHLRKLKPSRELLAEIETSHAEHVADFEWQKEDHRFCPRLVNWLKKRGWLDRLAGPRPIVSERTARTIAAVQNAVPPPEDDDR